MSDNNSDNVQYESVCEFQEYKLTIEGKRCKKPWCKFIQGECQFLTEKGQHECVINNCFSANDTVA